MPVGFMYDGMWPLRDLLSVVEAGDRAGLDSVWLAEHATYRDALVTAASVLHSSESVRVIPGPINPYTRHPVAIAMAAASLAEIRGGRVGLQLGTGNPVAQRQLGVEISRPIATLEETLDTIRALCGGDTVTTKTGGWDLRDVRLHMGTCGPVPLYLAAIGPRMLSLARRKADGTVLSAAISPAYVRYCLESREAVAGAGPEEVHDIVGFILGSVQDDRPAAYDQIRPLMAYMTRTPALAKDWELNGLEIDHEAILAAILRDDPASAAGLISDRAVMTLSATGTPDDFQRRLEAYMEAGVDLPVVAPVGDLKAKIRVMELAIDVCGKRQS